MSFLCFIKNTSIVDKYMFFYQNTFFPKVDKKYMWNT